MNRNQFIIDRIHDINLFSNENKYKLKGNINKRKTRSYKPFKNVSIINSKRPRYFSSYKENTNKIHFRKKRRQRSNYLANKRINTSSDQSHCKYLQNHLWHAKRMVMTNKYGFKLPIHSKNKGYKAFHRLYKTNGVVEDISYMQWICLIFNDISELHSLLRSYMVNNNDN